MDMSRIIGSNWKVAAFAGLLVGSACGKAEEARVAAPVAEPKAPTFSEKTFTVPGKFDAPDFEVTLKVPGGWVQHDFFKDKWVPSADADPMRVGVAFSRSCNGECSAAKIPDNIALAKKEAVESVTHPKTELMGISDEDAAFWKGTVEVIEDTTLANGAVLHVFRATYPEAPADKLRPVNGLFADCYIHGKDDTHYLLVEGNAESPNEKLLWPVLKEICGSVSYRVAAKAP